MKEPAVVDSTCLIGLERVGRLDLLPALFEPIAIPPEVSVEVLLNQPWLIIQTPSDKHLVHSLNMLVDAGEAEAIALACENSWRIILDDAKARAVAKNMNLKVIGTAGILIRAKSAGLVSAVAPILLQLGQNGFHLSQDLRNEVLRLCGE